MVLDMLTKALYVSTDLQEDNEDFFVAVGRFMLSISNKLQDKTKFTAYAIMDTTVTYSLCLSAHVEPPVTFCPSCTERALQFREQMFFDTDLNKADASQGSNNENPGMPHLSPQASQSLSPTQAQSSTSAVSPAFTVKDIATVMSSTLSEALSAFPVLQGKRRRKDDLVATTPLDALIARSKMPLQGSELEPLSEVQTKRKYKRKNKWQSGLIAKKKKVLNKDDKTDGVESEIDHENPESSLDHAEVDFESSVEVENDTSMTECASPTVNWKETVAAPENTNPTGSTAVNDPTKKHMESSQSITIQNGDHSELEDVRIFRNIRGKPMETEQQAIINVEKEVETLNVDRPKLKTLLNRVVEKSNGYNVFQMEKLYAILSQCIYRHRKDYDKTILLKEMEVEIGNFRI
ncbi:ATPase family AAA domain-containing protein 2 [Bombina bombina]|uniref:ATPase family AAA domain-containing protein 2 n=1 Tax=Bombina bombina TaxID=8345 RepID=UPI00235AAA79|nr:ATPase family AAA domain-containing protein 2 [Bombina bombina]